MFSASSFSSGSFSGSTASASLNIAELVAPMPTLHVDQGAALVAPASTMFASGGLNTSPNGANLYAPSPTISAATGAAAALKPPSPLLSASGTVTGFASAALVAPAGKLTASGTVSTVASAALSAPSPNVIGYFGAVASITLTGGPTVVASGTSGSIGYATLTAPLFELTASAARQNSGSAILAAPMPRMATSGAAWLVAPGAQLTAIGTAVVAVTYEAYALNLKHNPAPGQEPVDEMTRYTNYPFDRIMRYKNSYFGMNSTGLYLLEGTTDFAEPTPAPVQWNWRTTLTDFKSPQLKKLEVVYFGGRMPAAATVTVAVGEAGTESYNYTTPRGPSAQNYRQPLGKGMKARYYALGASGAGELALDTLTFNVTPLARKV
jgi:hypothetical protein